ATSGRSTSRVSLMGLPLSIDSRTASSRERSWMMRAIRNKYLPRSRPLIGPHTFSWARRAAATARSMSTDPATATRASSVSSAGLTVVSCVPSSAGVKAPSMNRSYVSRRVTTERDSGAGAYSKISATASVLRVVVGTRVGARGQLGALHEQVVEEAGGTDPEQVGCQPGGTGGLVDQDQVSDRVLGGADPTCGFDPHPPTGGGVVVPHRLQHHQDDRQGRGGRDLAGGGLDEVGPGPDRQMGSTAHVVVGHQLPGFQYDFQVRAPTGLLDRGDLLEDLEVVTGQEGATVDDHVDLGRALGDRVAGVDELGLQGCAPGRERGRHGSHFDPGTAQGGHSVGDHVRVHAHGADGGYRAVGRV